MARLFTFGCSYTLYAGFPTWADLLALEFDECHNWGHPGIGCRAIVERIAECHAVNKINKDDIVIVQWTTHLRHDWHTPISTPFRRDKWKTYGSIFAGGNADVHPEYWIKTCFNEQSYIMHSLNSMILAQELLKSTGCTWYMTSIGDWQRLGTDCFFTEVIPSLINNNTVPVLNLKDNFPNLSFYIKPIWEDHADHWLDPIYTTEDTSVDKHWIMFDPGSRRQVRDPHPSPRQYAYWLNTVLRPALGLGDPPDTQSKWLDSLDYIKESHLSDPDRMNGEFHHPERSKYYWPDDIWPGKLPQGL